MSDLELAENRDVLDNKRTDTYKSLPVSTLSTTDARLPVPNGPLQHLTDLLGRNMKLDAIADFKGSIPAIPINDLRGEEASAYTRNECSLRRSLAALYRLVDIRGWSQSIYNHISARCTEEEKCFLINPFGLLYHEIQASSFVKIDEEGNVVQQGSTVLSVNTAGWTLHSALHSSRNDVNCIVHLHLPDVIAVSCIKAGLLPVSPEAVELILHRGVRYHEYQGIIVNEAERASIQSDLGPKAKILFLRNHGVAVAAASIPEAWYLVKRVVAACQTQMLMLQLGGGASMLAELKENAKQLEQLANSDSAALPSSHSVPDLDSSHDLPSNGFVQNGKAASEASDIAWSPEELEFEAEMRVLDSAGYRTGHLYRQPNLLRKTGNYQGWSPESGPGGGYTDQMTGAELMTTTDFSAAEFSGPDDIAAAEKAGVEQMAKISNSVRASRQKGIQRNQWLSHDDDRGVVSSSMLEQSPEHRKGDFALITTNATPVRRPPRPNGDAAPVPPLDSTDQNNVRSSNKHFNRSATLPASSKNLKPSSRSDTLDRVSSTATDEEKAKGGAKIKKRSSFRMPSFTRKKKHQQQA